MKFFAVILWCLMCHLAIAQTPTCLEASKSAEFLKGTWVGRFHQYSCGLDEKYPMTIEIKEVKGKTFSGFFIWEDNDAFNGVSTLRGEIKGNRIFMYEDEMLSGKDLVLNGEYEMTMNTCTSLQGIWRLNELQPEVGCDNLGILADGGSYSLQKIVTHKVEAKKPEKERRKVVVKDEVAAKAEYITIKLWDHGKPDGDIVTLKLNDKVILSKFTLTRQVHDLIIPLPQKENVLELYAENLGAIPPNTAAIAVFSNGVLIKRVILKSDMNTSEAIKIVTN